MTAFSPPPWRFCPTIWTDSHKHTQFSPWIYACMHGHSTHLAWNPSPLEIVIIIPSIPTEVVTVDVVREIRKNMQNGNLSHRKIYKFQTDGDLGLEMPLDWPYGFILSSREDLLITITPQGFLNGWGVAWDLQWCYRTHKDGTMNYVVKQKWQSLNVKFVTLVSVYLCMTLVRFQNSTKSRAIHCLVILSECCLQSRVLYELQSWITGV